MKAFVHNTDPAIFSAQMCSLFVLVQAIYEKVSDPWNEYLCLFYSTETDCFTRFPLVVWLAIALSAIRSLQARSLGCRGRPSAQGRRRRDRMHRRCQIQPLVPDTTNSTVPA